MNKPKFDFAVGGQAVIEGVMMRSKNFIAVAVRKYDGSIKIKDFPFTSIIQRHKWLNIPLVRGVVGMVEMMGVGFKALNFSADEFAEEEAPTSKTKDGKEEAPTSKTKDGKDPVKELPKEPNKFLEALFLIGNLGISLGFAILLFKFLPLTLTEVVNNYYPNLAENYVLYNALDGVLKLTIFSLYILVISLSTTIRRVFEYHGAEHKAVFNYEHDIDLNVKNSQAESRFHPRCGTSFVIFIFLISVVLYTFLPRDPNFVMHFLKRVMWLPLIAGIAYEVLKYSAKHMNSWFVKIFTAPGMAFQGLTTKEPSDDQVEVALAALNRTLELEESLQKGGTDTQV